MHKAILWLQAVLIPMLGPFGLFIIAILDSSFLSLPEVNDLLVVSEAAVRPGTAWMYVIAATAGSVVGCSILWMIGRRGGEPLLVRRFGRERVERTRRSFRKWDVLAVAIPSMLPPPMPFKVFVLSSGVFGVPYPRFVATLIVARGARYAFWGVMGAVYGPRAVALLKDFDAWFAARAPWILGGLLAAAAAAVLAVWLRRRREAPAPEKAL
jgi:membrane protein YqaA with SNARE-associated domain